MKILFFKRNDTKFHVAILPISFSSIFHDHAMLSENSKLTFARFSKPKYRDIYKYRYGQSKNRLYHPQTNSFWFLFFLSALEFFKRFFLLKNRVFSTAWFCRTRKVFKLAARKKIIGQATERASRPNSSSVIIT